MNPETTLAARPNLLRRVAVRFQTVTQLFSALWNGPFWWLTPFAVALVFFAVILTLLQAIPAVAPFVYALL